MEGSLSTPGRSSPCPLQRQWWALLKLTPCLRCNLLKGRLIASTVRKPNDLDS